MKIIRVFPRRTNATPDDDLVRTDIPGFFDEADKILVSVTFTYDIRKGEFLAEQWRAVTSDVELGGPAFDTPEGEFVPGKFLKKGHLITSRGCPNRCWFCRVWRRNPEVIELPIREGTKIHDDNILATSRKHIEAVFAMLRKQKEPAGFLGGFEAKLLKAWHVDLLRTIKLDRVFFAYDTPDDWEPLVHAAALLKPLALDRRCKPCYLLIGYPKDTLEKAEERLVATWNLGFLPYAMRYRAPNGKERHEFTPMTQLWTAAALTFAHMKARKCDAVEEFIGLSDPTLNFEEDI